MEETFNKVMEALTLLSVLAFPDFRKSCIVATDASAVAIDAVLSEKRTKRVIRSVRKPYNDRY